MQKLNRISCFCLSVFYIDDRLFVNPYFARAEGDYMYAELIDRFDPNLQLNPPNFSVILHSAGMVLVAYHLSEFASTSLLGRMKIYTRVYSLICVLGKYSLDNFCGISLFEH